jgi:hypothetical protein
MILYHYYICRQDGLRINLLFPIPLGSGGFARGLLFLDSRPNFLLINPLPVSDTDDKNKQFFLVYIVNYSVRPNPI